MRVDDCGELLDVIRDIVKDHEKRIQLRLDQILREVGLDGILGAYGGGTSINGHLVNPQVYEVFVVLASKNRGLEVENEKLRARFLNEELRK